MYSSPRPTGILLFTGILPVRVGSTVTLVPGGDGQSLVVTSAGGRPHCVLYGEMCGEPADQNNNSPRGANTHPDFIPGVG